MVGGAVDGVKDGGAVWADIFGVTFASSSLSPPSHSNVVSTVAKYNVWSFPLETTMPFSRVVSSFTQAIMLGTFQFSRAPVPSKPTA